MGMRVRVQFAIRAYAGARAFVTHLTHVFHSASESMPPAARQGCALHRAPRSLPEQQTCEAARGSVFLMCRVRIARGTREGGMALGARNDEACADRWIGLSEDRKVRCALGNVDPQINC